MTKSTPNTSGKKRGRPKKTDSNCNLIQTKLNLSPEGWNSSANKTSKPTSQPTTPAVQIEKTVSKRGRVRKTIVYDDAISVSSESKSEEEIVSEDDFKPDNLQSEEEEEESTSLSLVSEKDSIELESEGSVSDIIIDKSSGTTPRKGATKSKKQKESSFLESTADMVDKFNADEVIETWNYELDPETKMFTRPIIPLLSDAAVKPFLSKNAKPKCVIYNCPFCQRIFTYTLVFKNHLYSCEKNTNVPD